MVIFLGQEDALEEETATHSTILTWTIPRTEEPGRLESMGSQRVAQLSNCTHALIRREGRKESLHSLSFSLSLSHLPCGRTVIICKPGREISREPDDAGSPISDFQLQNSEK